MQDLNLTRYGHFDDARREYVITTPRTLPDQEGFHIYTKDGASVWNPGWQPVAAQQFNLQS